MPRDRGEWCPERSNVRKQIEGHQARSGQANDAPQHPGGRDGSGAPLYSRPSKEAMDALKQREDRSMSLSVPLGLPAEREGVERGV
jgi:hypothetical protein